MQARVDINYIWLIHLDWIDLCTLAAGSFQEPWGCFADIIHRNSIELVSISGSIVTQKSLTRLFNPACGGNQSTSGYLHSRKLFYQCRNGVIPHWLWWIPWHRQSINVPIPSNTWNYTITGYRATLPTTIWTFFFCWSSCLLWFHWLALGLHISIWFTNMCHSLPLETAGFCKRFHGLTSVTSYTCIHQKYPKMIWRNT